MALKPLNSVGGFSVGEIPANIILANGDITSNNANLTANLVAGNVLTNNLLYANGQPWDLQEAAGANKQIQFNDGSGDFAASANLTFDSTTNLLDVIGNIQTNGRVTADTLYANANANVGGNLNVTANANVGNNLFVTGNANVTTDLNVNGNAYFGNAATNQLVSVTGNAIELRGGWNNATAASAALVAGDYGNSVNWGKINILGNVGGNSTAQLEANIHNFQTGGGGANIVQINTINVNAVSNTTGALTVAGGLGITGNAYIGGNIYANNLTGNISGNVTAGGINTSVQFNDANTISGGNYFLWDKTTNTMSVIGNILTEGNIISANNANINLVPNGTGIVVIANTEGGATGIQIGDPAGNLISNAVALTNSTSVSNALQQLNLVLGKLVPPSPTNFPIGVTLSVNSLSTYRMANFTQTDNTPGANKSVAGGTTVTTVRRAASYATNTVANRGPGDQGTIAVYLNGNIAGSRTLTANLDGNGTYSNLVITNNVDYNTVNANIAAGFWSVFTSYAAGTVTEGWNEVKITDSATGNTNMPSWYYDASAPGTPQVSNASITAPGSPSYTYSSTVAHYNNTNAFTVSFDVNRLSGDMYPTSDTFVTGTAGGAFGAPVSLTYATAGITTPLDRNLYVSSGNATVSTTSTIISGFGASSGSPSVSVLNSYATGTGSFSPGANVLYKTGTASTMEESNIVIGGSIGSGSGLAFRIINPGSTDTPSYSANATAFNSQSSTLETYDAAIVAAIMKHDQTNYSTGYLPVGPDLSSGRSGSQYFTFKFIRTSVSKFDFKWTGTIAGLWVALPGSAIDTSSTLNGWLDASVAYAGAGQPGAGSGGNGSNGCALGGVAPLNSAQTNKAITLTFGTVSSSSTATNEIYVRIKLTSGQSVTAFSLQPASN